MKSVRDDIKKIWRECFDDTREYVEMYFDRVYRESDALTLERDGVTVSSLLLQSYTLRFQGADIPVGYIAGAATRRSARGQGYMSRLMLTALHKSRERGDVLCTLIPAHDWLFFYYDRFGFRTVFYNDRQRFTSLHQFPGEGSYSVETDAYSERVYDAFHRFEENRGCGIIHSRRDFLNALDDMRYDPDGTFVVMNDEHGDVASMAWALTDNGLVIVKELLAKDDNARQAALRALRSHFPDMPFMVLAPPEEGLKRHLYSKAMGRIVNVGKCLEITAAAHPEISSYFRVTDGILADNSHIYRIKGGRCDIRDDYRGPLDLDVSVEIMTEIIFSSPKIGDIIGFPSERPHMSLMLD